MNLELMSDINQYICLFGSGVLIGKFTGSLSTLIITGSALYFFYPQFTYETIMFLKNETETILNQI